MTSRNSSEKPLSSAQGGGEGSDIVSDTSPAVPAYATIPLTYLICVLTSTRAVIIKLLAFTFAMVVVPLGSFFFTRAYVFSGNSTYSGGFAALMANVVLVAYVIVAMLEDQSDMKEKKKAQ